MYSKEQQLLTYIIKHNTRESVTSLMKLCYLIDLYGVQENSKQVTNFKYKRYNYGPFDNKLYKELESLVENEVITEASDYTSTGLEYVLYTYKDGEFSFNKIESDLPMIDKILDSLKGYGAKMLTEVAYKTKPMKALGATLGGNENYNSALDLTTK